METKENSVVNDDTAGLKKVVEPLPGWLSVWYSFCSGSWSFIKWIFGWIISILQALLSIFTGIGNFFIKLYGFIKNGVKDLYHKFHFNDLSGRLSFVLFGSSSFAHHQYTNGVLYIVFEIAYLVLFGISGWHSIYMLGTLGTETVKEECTDDPLFGQICKNTEGDNSILILIYGLLWVFSLVLFLYIWKRSINAGYSNFRITHYEEFSDRIAATEESSQEMVDDIKENNLYNRSFKDLKGRYSSLYDKQKASAKDKMGQDYACYILDETIISAKVDNQKVHKLLTKKQKEEKALAEIQSDEMYIKRRDAATEKYQSVLKALSEKEAAYSTKREAYLKAGALTKEEQKELDSLAREKRSAKNHMFEADNHLASINQWHERRVSNRKAKIDDLSNKLLESQKSFLAFAVTDDAQNHSKYGKFNAYYKTEENFDHAIDFWSRYFDIVKQYDYGSKSFATVNSDNAKQKEVLLAKYKADVAAINENYVEIGARRTEVEKRQDEENTSYKSLVVSIKSQGLDASSQKEKLAEAKFNHFDKLKTLRGIMESLPTPKEVKAGKKEDLGNATHAYKRDTKALKTDFTAQTCAEFEAENFMVVNCELTFTEAKSYIKLVKANKSVEEVEQQVTSLKSKKEAYTKKYPTKFDGKPKTFKAQMSSLLDENFHITLLALPLLGIVIFTVMPLFFSILIAFTNYSLGHTPPTQLFTWVGLKNFNTLFNPGDTIYANLASGLLSTLSWTIIWAIIATFSNYFLGIIFALMINKKGIKFKKLWRFIFVLSIAVPQFISLIGLSVVLSDGGAVGKWWLSTFHYKLGFGTDTTNDALVTKIIIILINIWIGIPYTILSTTGILMNIPKDLYESSTIDGAGPATQFVKITLPYIFFVTGPSLITTFIGNINNFGVIYFLTGGGPSRVPELSLGYTDLLITFLYKMVTSASNPQYGLASTIGIIVFVICAFFSLIVYNRSDSVTKEDQFQ